MTARERKLLRMWRFAQKYIDEYEPDRRRATIRETRRVDIRQRAYDCRTRAAGNPWPRKPVDISSFSTILKKVYNEDLSALDKPRYWGRIHS